MICPELRHGAKGRRRRRTLARVSSSPLRVGLTGGIASGKTLVAALLETCGAPVAFADQMARGIMEDDLSVRRALEALLGEGAYRADGTLDRPALGARLFADEALLAQVNAIVHPAVGRAAEAWHARQEGADYTVYESALLFETGAAESFDVVVVVHAPRLERLRRAMARDGVEEVDVLARMDAQLTDAERLARPAYVIVNDGSRALIPQAVELHRSLLALAMQRG